MGIDLSATEAFYVGHDPAFGEKYEFQEQGLAINANCQWGIRIGGNDESGYRKYSKALQIQGVMEYGIDIREAIITGSCIGIPNNSQMVALNASGTASATLMYLDTANVLQIGGSNCTGLSLAAGQSAAWDGGTTYVIGDCCNSGGVNYKCILGHLNHVPPNITYWESLANPVYVMVDGLMKNVTIDGSGFLKGA